jgi:hypothetical protein
MKKLLPLKKRLLASLVISAFATFALPAVSWAQNSTATIRGKVSSPNAVGAEVVAKEVNTGFTTKATVGSDGNYVLSNIKPGSYAITASSGGKEIASSVAVAQVGQQVIANLDATAGAKSSTELESVNVTAASLAQADIRNSEVATNVTQQQIQDLPQVSRNFLNFAALAPGVQVSRKSDTKSFSSMGQDSNQTNVYIDGANLKNNILQGGLSGQDSTKGNPFSQEAIQEYRVLTQNFKAEYEQAGSSLITAITKSGTNEFHGSVFGDLQTTGMGAQEYFSQKNGNAKPPAHQEQYGATLGGPIITDTLQFFLDYEANKQNDSATVNINNAKYGDLFKQFNGTFAKPFHEKTFFGKLSWQPNENNNVDLSVSRRKDEDVAGFGGNAVYDARQIRISEVNDLLLKWQFRGHGFVNDFLIDIGEYKFNPKPANPDIPSIIYDPGIAVTGGSNQTQNKQQKNKTISDAVTFDSFSWYGDHVIKVGASFAHINERVLENYGSTPQYIYNTDSLDTGILIPERANFSPSGKHAELGNNQTGFFAQDDWDVSSRLQLNLGMRWDYESNAYNNGYVTPQNQYEIINYLHLGNDYISTGNNREGYKGEFQPRVGFSYDLSKNNDQSTTLFGGAGRYFDRTPLDNSIQEAFHSQYPYYNFTFSSDGRNGSIKWDPKYLTVAGLQSLITANAASGEIDVLNNKTKPPHTDQFNLGMKQVLGDWIGSLTVTRSLSYNQFTWLWNRKVADGFQLNVPAGSPFGVVLHNGYKKYEDTALLIGINKPYTKESNWGFGLAYTYSDGHKSGGDAYSLDYADPSGYPYNHTTERHHVVMNGTVGLPWEVKLSGIITLGSGLPQTAGRGTPGCDYNCNNLIGYYTGSKYTFILPSAWAYRSVDLSLSKDWDLSHGMAFQLRLDVKNALNYKNFDGSDGNLSDKNFGEPNSTLLDPRQVKIGGRFSF